MLWTASALNGYPVRGADGKLGNVAGLMYDETDWTIRWLLVDTGDWLSGRQVPLPIATVGQPDQGAHLLPVDLTMQQVENCPDVDVKRAFSRQLEFVVCDHFQRPAAQGSSHRDNGEENTEDALASGILWILTAPGTAGREDRRGDHFVHSIAGLSGGVTHAVDGDIGQAQDVLIDPALWRVGYLVVHTSGWWPSRKCLVSPPMIDWIDRTRSNIHLKVTRQEIKASPRYDAVEAVDGEFEELFHSHYGTRAAPS
jgi:hypothetical protein